MQEGMELYFQLLYVTSQIYVGKENAQLGFWTDTSWLLAEVGGMCSNEMSI